MATIEKTLEMRGMSRKDLVQYFLDLGGYSLGNGKYCGSNWEVHIDSQTSCYLGTIIVPSTKVTFTVDEKYFEEILSKFRFKFLCAGG